MRRPRVGIDEDLDHQRHDQEGRGAEAGEEAERQKDRKQVLRIRRRVGRDLGFDQRQRVIGSEELKGSVVNCQKPRPL